jgi:3-oxoacyl-[acyl-carrier-protein] synthase-3
MSNAEIARSLDTSDEWIAERTGIRRRHIAGAEETASSMAEVAARKAIEAADIEPDSVDLIVLATSSPDRVYPSTACLLQERLGIRGCAAFDVQAACAGFSYVLGIAHQFIRSGSARNALVVSSEVNSRILDWTDRGTCIIFGDGAGAVVLEAAEEPGILSTHLHADGQYKDLLYVPNPLEGQEGDGRRPHMRMFGNEVFKVAVNTLGQAVEEALSANGAKQADVDWLVPHQANIRIIRALAKKLHMPMERVIVTIEDQGNTSGASIPLALDEGIRDGRIQRGDTLLLVGFGGGFAWGSALVRY